MSKYKIYLVLVLFFVVGGVSFSQNASSDYFSNVNDSGIQNRFILQNSSFQQDILTTSQLTNGNVQNGNVVVLNQVGLNNVADIKQSLQTQQTVSQLGNNNYYSFIDYYNSEAIQFGVLQNGNSNSLQIYGSNSMMDGMKIVQNSNFKNIVIKNYK